jgi:hypothetical protein
MRLRKLSVLAIAVALAGCGSSGSSGVTPANYVKSVCTAIGPFEHDVLSSFSSLNLSPNTSPAQGKTVLQGFLSRIASDSDKALNQLKAAGTPNVKNGKQISDTITNAFSQIDSAMKKASSQASSLPTDSPQAFKTAVQSLVNNVRSSMTTIGTSLQGSTLKSPELESAAAKEPACKSLGSP